MFRGSFRQTFFAVLICVVSTFVVSEAKSPASENRDSSRIRKFVTLDGSSQVKTFFREAIDRALFLRLPGSDGWVEQEILIGSPDISIEEALAVEAKHANPKHAGFAAFLLCRRAQFFPQSQFPVTQISGTRYSEHVPLGLFSPFDPNLERLTPKAREAVQQSLLSSNQELRTTSSLYCGTLSRELSTRPATELAQRWRNRLFQLRAPIYYMSDATEAGEEVRLLRRALIEKGIEGALALQTLLREERQPLARDLEIDLIAALDASSVRLRGSRRGREILQAVENIVAQERLELYSTEAMKQRYLKTLRGCFYDDDFLVSDRWAWSDMLLFTFNKYFDESVTVPDRARVRDFIAYLTSIDPTFPSWEFVSSGSQADMLHPQFRLKIARYHEAWTKFNQTRQHPLSPAK